MLQNCLDIFEKKYREHGERLILDNYELKEGTYKLILIDDDFRITDTLDVKRPKRGDQENNDNANSKLIADLKFYDYHGKYLNSNKAVIFGEGKIIQSASYMAFAIKKNSLADMEKLRRVTEKYYDTLKNPLLKYKKGKTADIYREFEEDAGKPDSELIDRIREYILSGRAWEDVDKEKKDYLKLFFVLPGKEETEEVYKREHERYLIPNLYNSNEYNVTVGDEVFGLPDNNMGMNSKKPFLANKTRKIATPYLLNREKAKLQNSFFDYLYGGVAKGEQNVYLWCDGEKAHIVCLPDNKEPVSVSGGYYLRLSIGNSGADIIKSGAVPNYNPIMEKKFILRDFVSHENEKKEPDKRYGQKRERIWEIKAMIDDIFFNGMLKNNFFADAKDIKCDNVMKRCILESRDALHNWFYLGESKNAVIVLRKVSWELIKCALSENNIFEARRRGDLRWSLIDYFNDNERMWESMSDVREKLRQHINSKEEWMFDDGKELSYAIGQAVYYLLSKSKASSKPASTINPFLSTKDISYMKTLIRRMYVKYNYSIEASANSRENQLFSHIARAESEDFAVNKDFIFAGFADKNLIYEPGTGKEEGGKDDE